MTSKTAYLAIAEIRSILRCALVASFNVKNKPMRMYGYKTSMECLNLRIYSSDMVACRGTCTWTWMSFHYSVYINIIQFR
jgi:hypothetical protein